ncbi:MAG TPA: class I SAM-dependent methyltransferase [Patescibacteria group bacterium]|nr:class I SAM-dependent methyltransferase [Patescibacteria group bacterium]
MVIWIIIVLIVFFLLLALPVVAGPPYVPTLRLNINTALDLLDLKPGQTLLDLGSGDGRVLAAAAQRGINVIGIELSPILALLSYFRTHKYRKQVRVRIIWGNYFLRHWPEADGIFGFLIQHQMRRLDAKIEEWHDRPVRLASFAFRIPDKQPTAEREAVFLYEYK